MQSSSQDENVVADEQQWVGADASEAEEAACLARAASLQDIGRGRRRRGVSVTRVPLIR